MDRVVRADGERGADLRRLAGGREHQVRDATPVVAADVTHVVGQGMRMHRDFGMAVLPHHARALGADRAIAQRRPLGAHPHDPDVLHPSPSPGPLPLSALVLPPPPPFHRPPHSDLTQPCNTRNFPNSTTPLRFRPNSPNSPPT